MCNAERHSAAMAAAGRWFLMDLRPIVQTLCGRYVSQVVAKADSVGDDAADADTVLRLWMKHPTTRALILHAPLSHAGCGAVVKDSYVYATCLFIIW